MGFVNLVVTQSLYPSTSFNRVKQEPEAKKECYQVCPLIKKGTGNRCSFQWLGHRASLHVQVVQTVQDLKTRQFLHLTKQNKQSLIKQEWLFQIKKQCDSSILTRINSHLPFWSVEEDYLQVNKNTNNLPLCPAFCGT